MLGVQGFRAQGPATDIVSQPVPENKHNYESPFVPRAVRKQYLCTEYKIRTSTHTKYMI